MSLNININKMSYNGRSYAERAEAEKRKINRIISVREQSSELAQKLLKKTRCAKEQELKKLQKIKEKELSDWKRQTQCEIQKQIDNFVGNFGDAHIAAVNASCEEDEFLRDKRDEQDLMAAMRGRVAMLQVQRERERELENKLLKKKRQQQKTVGIQADFLTQRRFSENLINKQKNMEMDLSEEEGTNDVFTVKPNPHKHSEQQYNPQNYTTNSVDSSNNCDSEIESIAELEEDDSIKDCNESEAEFNQITNLLRHRLHNNRDDIEINEIIDVGSSDSESISYQVELPKKVTIKTSPIKKKKGILKKSPSKPVNNNNKKQQNSPVKNKNVQSSDNRVRYVDFGNKYETTYVPDKNLIVRNEKSKTNARQNAQIQTDDDAITKKINEDILKQLTDLRSQEALEKEKIRRDYERLRLELDDLSKQEQEAKSRSNMHKNLTRDKLLRKEEIRQQKMNEAAENAMKKNIITCPPVDRNEKSTRQKLSEINVAAPSSSSREESDKSTTIKLTRSNSEINNLVKVEKLKDLLEKINHQKRLLLNEIEKSEDIPGPDLEKVMDCIKKLEQEKAALNSDNKIDESKLKKVEELNEREKKIQEREKRLENNLRELFKKQQQKEVTKSSPSHSEQTISDNSSTSSEKNTKKIVQSPVEIIIKVQPPKSPYKKSRKSYRCVDTLSRSSGKIYPKTPIKKRKSIDSDIEIIEDESQKLPEKEKSQQQQTQTSPVNLDAPKPILKNSQLKQISIPPKSMSKESSKSSTSSVPKQKQTADSEDFSVSTVYHELPPQINLISGKESQRKLNPLLMDYITRVLGMNKNIGSQLNIDVSSVTTPGSSTINTTGNRSSNDEISFDQDRMNRLQKFIDDNHSFISEINDSLERVEVQKKHDKDQEKLVEGIWREILNKKKSSRKASENQSKISSNAQKSKAPTAPSNASSKKVPKSQQLPQKEPKQMTKEKSQPAKTQRPRISQEDMTDVSKYLESQMLNNYSEYTANCQRRIAELTQMMEKVRQEKLKLIENSLSSNELNNFTEYKDIVHTTATKDNVNGSTETKESPSNRDDPPSEEINNILQFQTRPFGVSKDSGISGVSRPVTSSDFRDTPPDRVACEDNNNLFQPILKDIPKLPRMKITTSDGETQTIKDVSGLIKQQQEKKQRPPLSLKSPQFEKQHEPHELSTIVEIETPTASKVNIQEEISGVGALQSFPNFEAYDKNNQQPEISFPDMNDLMKALPDLNIKTFVGHEEHSIANFTKDDDDQEILSTNSSLIDIMDELKKRNLIESSFQIYYDENKDNLVEAGCEKDDKTTPTTTHQMTEPISPKRKQAQSRLIMKTPEHAGKVEKIHTPIKEKHHGLHTYDDRSVNSNDTLSGIQEIEKDFQTHGMGWAVSTMKKTGEASKKHAASSSSSDNQDSIKINFEYDSSTSSSDGRPLNLRDFLRRELLTRSKNDPYMSDDSSLSSKFIKSLLKASQSLSSSSSSNDPKSESSQNIKLRTSTPVRASSENLAKTGASSHVFNGVDSVSTVKDSSNDKSDKSNNRNNENDKLC